MLIGALSVGTIAGWLTFAVILSGLVLWVRGGGPTAIAALQAANSVLTERVKVLEQQAREHRTTIETLRASRDFASALQPLIDQAAGHEEREAAMFATLTASLDRLAVSLAPKPITRKAS